ncbi:MAG: 50S ribosomal protein L18 [Ruminococcaceae bacterium]|nr:50S ribosomal protein L18 [Oscillospiraceae bacterium]
MIKKVNRKEVRVRKHVRVRKKISGTAECPRLAVFRSASHIYAQIIDDDKGVTLVAASSLDKAIKEKVEFGGNVEAAKEVGKLVAEKAIEAGITDVVFDRGGYMYHGRIQALADSAREAGLKF